MGENGQVLPMASVSQSVMSRPMVKWGGRNGWVDRYFYFAMSLLTAGIVVWGFSHTVMDNLVHAAPPRPWLLWVHGAAFSSWVVFYIVQTSLVRTHNVRIHRTLGWFGAGLGATMVVLGISVSLVMGHFDLVMEHQPAAPAFQLVGFTDMLGFGTVLALAIWWRRKPVLHRPLIFIATCLLLDAAFARFDYIFVHHLWSFCVDGMILLGVLRDLVVDGRVNKVYLWTLPALAVVQWWVLHTVFGNVAWWQQLSHRLMG
jgi:hypothetical protein